MTSKFINYSTQVISLEVKYSQRVENFHYPSKFIPNLKTKINQKKKRKNLLILIIIIHLITSSSIYGDVIQNKDEIATFLYFINAHW